MHFVVNIMMVVVTIMIFSFNSFAQNLHTALWNFGNKCLDFRSGELVVSDLPKHTFDINEGDDIWYVDESGRRLLRFSSQEGKLYGQNEELVRNSEGVFAANAGVIFVPRPQHPNHVYCISSKYVIVDVEKNEVVGDIVDFGVLGAAPSLVVHSEDCSFIWLGIVNRSYVVVYQINENGIFYKKKIEVQGWPAAKRTEPLHIKLSADCCHYCAVGPKFPRDEEPVFYGEFDRKTCEFKRISMHIFHQKVVRQRYVSSIISPDKKFIYLLVMLDATSDAMLCDIKRVPIVGSVPDYESMEIVKRISVSEESHFRYAVDGNIYVLDYIRRRISRIVNPDGASPEYEADVVIDDSHPYPAYSIDFQNFISSWVTSDYCYNGISASFSCNTVKFYCSTSIAAKSFLWNFGDGAQSAESSPSHTYDTPGVYDVSVDVVFDDETSKTFTKQVSVAPVPEKPTIIME